MTCIEIDIDCHLHEASSSALNDEVQHRIAQGVWPEDVPELGKPHPWTRVGMAADIRQAFYARNASRLEMILAQLELREEV